jgi:predicted TIM-barrel fold metal-dependent hydrolase
MIVDAHLHVWQAAAGETPSVHTIVPPQTNVPIKWASQTLLQHEVQRAVLVQPVFRGEDNSYVAACAQAEPTRFAAVCVIDPRVPGADRRLEAWAKRGCRGLRLRPRLPAESAIFGDPSTFPLWQTVSRLQVVVSLLAGSEHAPAVDRLAARFPDVAIVLDHLGHPRVEAGVHDPEFQAILRLARHPRVYVKASGFYHFSREPFPYADCWDLVRATYDCFGPQRIVWGSDFPHALQRGGYARNMLMPEEALNWTAAEHASVMGTNALALYWPDTETPLSSSAAAGGAKKN